MEVIRLALGQLQTNTYIVIDQQTKECVIIDPADEGDRIIDEIERLKLCVKGILITHGHFDHIGAVNQLKQFFEVPVYAHQFEAEMMKDGNKNYSMYFFQRAIVSEANLYVSEGEVIQFGGGLKFTCIEVPGHTAHSICFQLEEAQIVFSGDTLMGGSIGRTDLFEGESDTLFKAIKAKLLSLPLETVVYPGHGYETTIGAELENNPYMMRFFLE